MAHPALDAWMLRALAPLDAVRACILRVTGSSLQPLLRDRGLRVALFGVGWVVLAFSLACAAPLRLLTVAPVALGVPHLLADLRYLIVRQQLHRSARFSAVVAPWLVLTVVQGSLCAGACAIAAAGLAADASRSRRALAVALGAALAGLVYAYDACAGVVFAHAHNLVALATWLLWARRRAALVPALLLSAVGGALVLGGALDGAILRPSALAPEPPALAADLLARGLAPGLSPVWAMRTLALFAAMQSLHYGVWLKLVPEEDRARAGIRSFAASYRALVRDLGAWLPLTTLCAALALSVWALCDLRAAYESYLRLALFHGPLELTVLTLFATERRRLAREDA